MVLLTRKYADARGDEIALIDEHGQWTWAEHHERANRLLNATRKLGHDAGGAIGILSGNRHEYMEMLSAFSHGGYAYPPINWHFSVDEMAYILENSGSTVLFADAAFADKAMAAAAKVDAVEHVVMFGDHIAEGARSYEDLLAESSAHEPDGQSMGAALMYTSGTTGRPKGVVSSALRPGNPIETLELALPGYAALLGMQIEGGRALLNAPGYHGGPYLFGVVPFAAGASLVMRTKWDPADMLRTIDEHGVTIGYAVPTHFVRLLRLPDEVKDSFDGSSLQQVFHTAAPCPPSVKRQMIDWWGPVITELYAATDAGIGSVISSEEWLRKPGSVGKATPINEIVIADADGKVLGPNEVGTIYVKSLTGTDYSYLGDDDKTKDAHLTDATVTVGDVGYLDDDGYLFLSDRKIDMIISGGVNIYPAEIEAHLITHPAVADVAVFGVPDDEFGESVKAAIELRDGFTGSDEMTETLRTFCREGLAGYKVPRTVDYIDEFPRTETGKLQKRKLRDPYWEGRERAI